MRKIDCIKIIAFMSCLLLIVSGCAGSKPSRFYTLDISKNQATKQPSSEYKLAVSIGPVEIPDYLDRPQIVSRTSQNEIAFSEFDRWAGLLQDDIARVLQENIGMLLSESAVSVSAWKWGADYDYRIAVYFSRFDIMPENKLLLRALWQITGKDGKKPLLTRESNILESVMAETYDAKVSSMSVVLEKLSIEIADGIEFISPKKIKSKK